MSTRASEVREPIPYGLVKLCIFVALIAVDIWSVYYWWSSKPAVAVLQMAGIYCLFCGVKVFHPEGWTDWLREYWFWNLGGVMECFQEKEDGEVDRWLGPFSYESPPDRHLSIYSGSWGIRIRRSGWSFREGWIMKRWHTVRSEFWSVRKSTSGSCLWEVAGEFSNPTTMVRLTQRDGSCMDLSVKQAFYVLHTLTVFDSKGCHIQSVRPFRDLLTAMASTTDTVAPSNGTA